MSSSALPPPGNLPSWSRISKLDRSRYPKPFLRDRIPLPPGGTTIATDRMMNFNSSFNNRTREVKFLGDVSALDQHGLLRHNSKSIKFLQEQHADTLKKLHDELDRLKRENRELHFKIILSHQGNDPNPTTHVNKNQEPSAKSDTITANLLEEIKSLKLALEKSHFENDEMQKTVSTLQARSNSEVKVKPPSITDDQDPSGGSTDRTATRFRRKYSVSNLSSPLPMNATLDPLQVRDSADEVGRIPSVTECEAIIKCLHETNCQQLSELSRLRMERKEVVSSGIQSPESSVLKTFGPNESFSDTRLPRIPMKPVIKKSIVSASSAERVVTLPALKNTVSSNVADRRKRQQAIQKARSKKEY